MGLKIHSSSSIYQYYMTFELPLRLFKFGTIILLFIFVQEEYRCFVAAQGGPGGNSNLRPGPYSPIQNIFFGPLLRSADRPPISQRGHNQHQPQQQQTVHQQNNKAPHSSNAALPPPPPPPIPSRPPPIPSRAPKSIGGEQNSEASTAPPAPSVPPGTKDNSGTNQNPAASGPGRPSPNPGLILTPNIDHSAHHHHTQQYPLQRHKKLRKNQLGKRPSSQLPVRRLPPPRHRPPIHHPRLRGPPRVGPIPLPPKKLKKLGLKKNNIPSSNIQQGGSIRGQPHPPPRGTPPTPTIRSPSTGDQHQHQHLYRGQGVTPPYGSTTGVTPTGTAPLSRDTAAQPPEELHHHHGSPILNFTPSHVQQQPTRNVHSERHRRPGNIDQNGRPHAHNDLRPKQQPRPAQEALPKDIIVGHHHENSNLLPPPPPPPPVIVDQLHKDIPIPGRVHTAESHHHPPQQTNTLNIQQQNHPAHESITPHQIFTQEEQGAHQHPHDILSSDLVKLLDPITGLAISSLPLSQVTTESDNNEHQQHTFSSDLPIPPQFQQQLVIDPPSNALFNDPDTPQDVDHSHSTGEAQDHNGLDHHSHHKHKDHALEHYHLPDDVLLKISPRGHSSGPVIISQIPVKSFQSADVHLSVKEPMPEKNKYPPVDAVPATSLAGSGAAVAQLLTAEARPPTSNNIEAQSRSDDSAFFYFSQPSDLSASDSEVSSQVAFNSQRLKTKDKIGGTENINQLRRERNGTPRQLTELEDDYHSNSSGDAVHDVKHLHEDNINHIDGSDGNRRIDNEVVRELVDCGGSDLGFCDMNSRYPGHMMGNLMSDCQELVYKGFVPVPEDLEELGDNNPLARYSNASKSAVRARAGSWSWKPYTYKKKQICSSELRFIRPGYARDSTGKWQVIVQTESLPQRVAIDLCHNPEKPCHLMSDCGRKSRCIQRYTFQHLLAVDPDNLHDCPTIRAFKFPAACVCHIEFPDYHSEFF